MDGKEVLAKFGIKNLSQDKQQLDPPITQTPMTQDMVTLSDIAKSLDKLLKAIKEGNASLKKIEVSLGPVGPEDGGRIINK